MKYLYLSVCLLFCACQSKKAMNTQDNQRDPHSFANPAGAVVKHLDLDLKVNFETSKLTGKAVWTISNVSGGQAITFDTRGLDIKRITVGDDGKNAEFHLGKEQGFMGRPLDVSIDAGTTRITIWYETSKDAAALQWLNPKQTAGKKRPFLYTQSEPILARTWIPCQDSPGIRFTYNARIEVPGGLMAIMSAENPQKIKEDGIYYFRQGHPIPAYLMALAVGNLGFKAIDRRTGIYAEPESLGKAVWEFADMGKMVNAAEKLYGPYRWGRYDILVLPPSFPYGGMENPMLTFATPTVIAGDRSLVNLVAHELAHSWSGNLVTNATWNDFWLNEGFTVYFERRIVERLYGREEAEMEEVLGFENLKEIIADLGASNKDTRLKGDYAGRDPDEGMTDIAYEKGYCFLKTIETHVGRAHFDGLLKGYFSSHAFRSVTTEDFLKYLDNHLFSQSPSLLKEIRVNDWVYQPGIPSNVRVPVSERFRMIDSLVDEFVKKGRLPVLHEEVRSANEQVYFIKALPDRLKEEKMAEIDRHYHFTKSGNSEVQFAWYLKSIQNGYHEADPYIESFLERVGRRKFLEPLYKAMAATPAGKTRARRIYARARPNYHSVAYNTIDKLLK